MITFAKLGGVALVLTFLRVCSFKWETEGEFNNTCPDEDGDRYADHDSERCLTGSTLESVANASLEEGFLFVNRTCRDGQVCEDISLGDDCDDDAEAINPGADEVCNEVDDDCDGRVDDADLDLDLARAGEFYADADGDGYGDPQSVERACELPAGFVANADDCDDVGWRAEDVHPGADEFCNGEDDDCDGLADDADLDSPPVDPTDYYVDSDGDGFGGEMVLLCEGGEGLLDHSTDCNDDDFEVNPGAAERCNGEDDDCDGLADDADLDDIIGADTEGAVAWWYDGDGDGFGDEFGTPIYFCSAPFEGFSQSDQDCNDGSATTAPGAQELCNGEDDDCDGDYDEEVGNPITVYLDRDGDGVGGEEIRVCQMGPGQTRTHGDCNDEDSAIYPSAPEVCDGVDQNCNMMPDEGVTSPFFADSDGDGRGDPDNIIQACGVLPGLVTTPNDCNDSEPQAWTGRAEICDGIDNNCNARTDEGVDTQFGRDADGDGFGTNSDTLAACEPPTGYVANVTDCNDANPGVNPSAEEVCDGVDTNCNGTSEELEAVDREVFYRDSDSDGYGAGNALLHCVQPAQTTRTPGDCDDSRPATHPGAAEFCNSIDDDCNGETDDPYAVDARLFYADTDGDSWGNPDESVRVCTRPEAYSASEGDCNDAEPRAFPGNPEVCDGIDNGCNGQIDEGVQVEVVRDADGDGYGRENPLAVDLRLQCAASPGWSHSRDDCNDNPLANGGLQNPGRIEICNDIDDDCDGEVDGPDASGQLPWYVDADADGFGNSFTLRLACGDLTSEGFSRTGGDCYDNQAWNYPGGTELCDGLDNDCDDVADDGLTNTWYQDLDGDGFGDPNASGEFCAEGELEGYSLDDDDCDDSSSTTYPGAQELCGDGEDNDCDTVVDETCSVFVHCGVTPGSFKVSFSGAISEHVIGLSDDDSLHAVVMRGGPGPQQISYTTDQAVYTFSNAEASMRKAPVFWWRVRSNPSEYEVDPTVVRVTGLCTMDRIANTFTYTP